MYDPAMPDPNFPALTAALQLYARSLPEVAVTKVKFELEPDYGPETEVPSQRPAEPEWVVRVTIKCFGGLMTKEAVDPEGADFLKGAEPIEVASYCWEERGDSFDQTMVKLTEKIRFELEQRLTQHQQGLTLAQDALKTLAGQGG